MAETGHAHGLNTIAVIGAGQMGSGIAQVMAYASLDVILHDLSPTQLNKGHDGIAKSLDRFVGKGTLTQDAREATLDRIRFTEQFMDVAKADCVIEAIVEDERTKTALFAELDNLVQPGAIFASNTSSIPITRLASATDRPGQVIGMHFMNPVPMMNLVEIIRGAQTTDETYAKIAALGQAIGKTTVVSRDFPGFISNRILMPMLNEAMFAVFEGVGSPEDIDTVMKLGMNHPMGPLTLADFIGLDTCLAILNVLYEGFKDPKYRPCPLLVQYVNAGYLGRKSGRGFFHYAATP